MLDDVMHRNEVMQRLAHFFIVLANRDKAIVHPIADELLTSLCLALRNLIFMVRKLQILTTRMNINRFA